MQNEKKKKGSPLGAILFLVFFMLVGMADEFDDDMLYGLIGLIVIVAVVLFVIKLAGGKKEETTHTHDRIDHQSDLVINPRTGQVENSRIRVHSAHSAREHWKQQLDGLLANGTIDREEYEALLNRKF